MTCQNCKTLEAELESTRLSLQGVADQLQERLFNATADFKAEIRHERRLTAGERERAENAEAEVKHWREARERALAGGEILKADLEKAEAENAKLREERLELHKAAADIEDFKTSIAANLAVANSENAKLRERTELAETQALASEMAMWKCCKRNAWGDGEHDPDCPHGKLLLRAATMEGELTAMSGPLGPEDIITRLHDEVVTLREELKKEKEDHERSGQAFLQMQQQNMRLIADLRKLKELRKENIALAARVAELVGAAEKVWVLKHAGIYFRDITIIGPRGTTNLKDAARFSTREEAMLHPVNSMSVTFYEPEDVTMCSFCKHAEVSHES